MNHSHRLLGGLLALLALTAIAYSPGLSGGFLFDDFVNLNAIGATGPVDNWPTFFRYVTSGTADPTGRPLALLSFLLDARDWPADPAPFLLSNLILHLVNGVVLFALLRSLGRRLDGKTNNGDWAALLGAGLWMLHPLLVSTTLYIVQREAMLPATFVLLGLLCFVHGHSLAEQASTRSRGLAWMVSGIVGGTFLGLLCKGNGMLLPLLAWVVQATILDTSNRTAPLARAHRYARWALVLLPSLAVLAYLAGYLFKLDTPIAGRSFTIGERLLTEGRVVANYLHLLAVPRAVSTGLYNDAFTASTGLLSPASTLPGLALSVILVAFAWLKKSQFPALSAAIGFYYVGHLLESTVVPLELYFEHRNYLPAMLLFWPLARGILSWKISRGLRIGVAFALLGLLATTTFNRAHLWGEPKALAILWATKNPDSSRAQATVAMMDTSEGNAKRAVQRLRPIWQRRPTDLQIAFNYINAVCQSDGLSAADSAALETALRKADADLSLINSWLGQAIDTAAAGQCTGMGLDDIEGWMSAVLANPKMVDPDSLGQEVEPLLAQIALRKAQPAIALQHYDRALEAFTTPDVAARQASMLARSGYFEQALAHLDHYERIKGKTRRPGRGMPRLHAEVLRRQGYWPYETAVLRAKLHEEIAGRNEPSPSPTKP